MFVARWASNISAATSIDKWRSGSPRTVGFRRSGASLNFPGDELSVWGSVVDNTVRDGLALSVLELGVRNQKDEETTPATAEDAVSLAVQPLPAHLGPTTYGGDS